MSDIEVISEVSDSFTDKLSLVDDVEENNIKQAERENTDGEDNKTDCGELFVINLN